MTATIDLDEIHVVVIYDSADPAEHGDIDRAVRDLAQLRAARKALADWELVLADYLADALGRNTIAVDGVGTVMVKAGAKRTEWDHDALHRTVVARARDERRIDPETGEVVESEGEAVGRVLAECARPSWRLTPLRERGIDPGEFCSTSPGRPSVIITEGVTP